MIRKVSQVVLIGLMALGLILTILNILSVKDMAANNQDANIYTITKVVYTGTLQPDGCYGEPLDCVEGLDK